MPVVFLVIQLIIAGDDHTFRIQTEQPSIEVCLKLAEVYLTSFPKESDAGGTAVAGCVVVVEPRQEAKQ